MKQNIKVFAYLKEQLGENVTIDLPEKVTAAEILKIMASNYPQLTNEIMLSQVALQQSFMMENKVYDLKSKEELALIPPVSGG